MTDEFGGDPSVAGLADAWAACASTDDPDAVCRNTFRLTLTPTRVRIDVRRPGATAFVRYYEAGLIDARLGNVLNAPGGFHVFLGDFAYGITDGTVVRFHWDRVAVNPHLLGGAPPTPTPPPTPPPPPTATATATPALAPARCEYLVWVDGAPTTQERQVATDPALRRALGCPV